MTREEYVGWLAEDNGYPIPVVDMGQPIVRCADCEHCRPIRGGSTPMCKRNCCACFPVEPDGYCSWGEPRGGEGE